MLVPPISLAQAAAGECAGESATIIGDGAWSDRLIGTPGRDVIVSNGAQFVDARGGDDLVCITGSASVQNSIKVFDGPGDDVVRNDSTFTASGDDQGNESVYVYLFAGDDTFVGGAAPEFVAAYTGTDDINTGAGFDTVFAGSPPADPEGLEGPFSGRIDLGDEGGRLYAGPLLQSSTILVGDTAQSELALTDDVPQESGWVIDAAAGEASIDGRVRYSFAGFTRFIWSSQDVARFTGTDGPDVVSARSLARADMGSGNDLVFVTSPGRVDLGPGDDRLDLSGSPSGTPSHVDAGGGIGSTGRAKWRTAGARPQRGEVADPVRALARRHPRLRDVQRTIRQDRRARIEQG